MEHYNTKPLKAGIWYTISNFFVKGITFLTTPFFTRFMSTSDVGLFSNIQSWFSILAIITTFELYSSVSIARFDFKDELDKYIASNLVLGSFITFSFYLIVLYFHAFFEKLWLMNFETINVVFLYLLVYPAIQMFLIRNQINYLYKSSVLVTFFTGGASTIISLTAVLLVTNKLMGRVYGYYIPLIVFGTCMYIYLLFKSNGVSTCYWKYSLAISFPLIWHLLASNILNSCDRVMITKMIGTEANALYSVAYYCGMGVALLVSSLNNAWSPWAYQKMDNQEYGMLRFFSKPYTLLFILVSFIFMILGPELLYVMGGHSYMEAVFVLPPVMASYVCQFLYTFFVNIEFYLKKQKYIALGTLIAACFNFVLNYIFIPKYGYIAAAYTTLAGYILLFLVHYYFVSKWEKSYWYDCSFFFSVMFATLCITGMMNLLYKYKYIMLTVIAICVVVVLVGIIFVKDTVAVSLKQKSLKPLKTWLENYFFSRCK